MKLRAIAPALVLLGGFTAAALLVATGPQVTPSPAEIEAPLVRVVEADARRVQLRVATHGTVVPRTESALVPEVSGRVEWVSQSLVSGGFFREGEPLLRIEALDYQVGLEQARARVARADSELANARTAHDRQLDLARQRAASDAQRDDAINRLRVAEAAKREADASLLRAERDLARTQVLAPYDGRVRAEQVDVGQFVNRGSPLGTLYAVDYAEVRLPIADRELAYLDLPLAVDGARVPAAPVTLRARFAGREHTWQGEVVRTEGELDPTTRVVHVVARVPDPYTGSTNAAEGGRPPLAVGLFVEAEIEGRQVDGVVVLPRTALRGQSEVLVVDAESRLRFRSVDVLRVSRDEVLVAGGLAPGERVCVSSLEAPVEGMPVRVREASEATAGTPPEGARS